MRKKYGLQDYRSRSIQSTRFGLSVYRLTNARRSGSGFPFLGVKKKRTAAANFSSEQLNNKMKEGISPEQTNHRSHPSSKTSNCCQARGMFLVARANDVTHLTYSIPTHLKCLTS